MLFQIKTAPGANPLVQAPLSIPSVSTAEREAQARAQRIGDDQLSLSSRVTPEQVKDAFDRLDKARQEVLARSVGTLGAMPAYERALKAQRDIECEIDVMRQVAPDLVAAEDVRRSKAEQASGGFFGWLKRLFS